MPDKRTSTMPLQTLTDLWRPGSRGDDWTWDDEHRELIARDITRNLLRDIAINGVREPVMLAHDGRVWDGHHRIVALMALSMMTGGARLQIPVEFVPSTNDHQAPTNPHHMKASLIHVDTDRVATKRGTGGPRHTPHQRR